LPSLSHVSSKSYAITYLDKCIFLINCCIILMKVRNTVSPRTRCRCPSSSTCENMCWAITLTDKDSWCPSRNSTLYSRVSNKGLSWAIPIGCPSLLHSHLVTLAN
jgi:hypothetical protein